MTIVLLYAGFLIWTKNVDLVVWFEKVFENSFLTDESNNELKPDSFIYMVRQENAYWVTEFAPHKSGQMRAKITLSPIDVAGDLT